MGKVNEVFKSQYGKKVASDIRRNFGNSGDAPAAHDMPEAYYTNHDPNAGAPTEQEKKDMEERRKAAEAAAARSAAEEEAAKKKKSASRKALE